MMHARIIGLGQSAAGDDGAGVAVVHALRERGLPSGVEVHHLSDPSALAALLETTVPIIIVDAVLGSPAGEVVEFTTEQLAARPPLRISSHGFSIAEAIGLARILNVDGSLPAVRIVAITIARPSAYQHGLSAEVAAAVPRAVQHVLSLVNQNRRGGEGLRE